MNTKRQYSLPNCNLVLEGMENVDPQSVDILDGKSPMSILINAECSFFNSNQQLSGGSVFLANLSKAVSNYAQGFLSGLSQPNKETSQYPRISIEQVAEQHCHRLTYEPKPGGEETRTEVNLTTVELFDLVDAIDQFYADRTALPDMSLELQSVSKRYRQPEQPLAQRLTPIVVGFTSLAMAAGAFFVIPPPEINTPKPTLNQTTKTKPVPKPESTPNSPTNTQPPQSNQGK